MKVYEFFMYVHASEGKKTDTTLQVDLNLSIISLSVSAATLLLVLMCFTVIWCRGRRRRGRGRRSAHHSEPVPAEFLKFEDIPKFHNDEDYN